MAARTPQGKKGGGKGEKAPRPAKAPKSPPSTDAADASLERLHKYLASTGAGSRRECETFIAQGRVAVNGRAISKMGVKVDPDSDVVTLDGERVRREGRVYFVLNKPAGYICTNSDERGRPRAVDLLRDLGKRVYTVGRLDADSTGLILLTNDGAIANIICHPRYRIEKRYQVAVRGRVTRDQIARVEAGVWLAEGKSSPALVKPVGFVPRRQETVLEMTLFEGRNREIRRVFGRVGLNVRRLQRTAIGPLLLEDLKTGHYRKLTPKDLQFVGEAERMYLAHKEAWDAELPPEEERRRRPRKLPDHRGHGGTWRDAAAGAYPPRGGSRPRGAGGRPSGGQQGGDPRRFPR